MSKFLGDALGNYAKEYTMNEAAKFLSGIMAGNYGNRVAPKPYRGNNRRRRAAPRYKRRRKVGSYKKRRYRRRKNTKLNKLSRKVNRLQKVAASGTGTYIWKDRQVGQVQSAQNAVNYAVSTGVQVSTLESAMDAVPMFDPSAPSTFITADLTSGTYQREVMIDSLYSKLTVRNNYNAPVRVCLYCCMPKKDTSISPLSAITNGLADLGSGLDQNTVMLYPSDSDQFKDLWSVVATKKTILTGGREATLRFKSRAFQYDPSFFDTHSLAYQRKYKSHIYLIRVEGRLGHDTSASQRGTLPSGVDYQVERKIVIKYDAGADIKRIEVLDTSSNFTNQGVVSTPHDIVKESFSVN
jgi:hypothetical protein